ncbi:MAG TPA: tetratricopeptide repeat protein [Candidatus Udaeobacter sp.]|nr:tetratricopeptide repeat protein [Candidatus Udaeobacter sp.]
MPRNSPVPPDEAKEFARRAAEGAHKVLGPDHPSTCKYEELLVDLEAKHQTSIRSTNWHVSRAARIERIITPAKGAS